jgi:hypothetical protein
VKIYHVVFEWPAAAGIRAETRRVEATDPQAAKAKAAELQAGEPFEHGPPTRYFVLTATGGRVFTFPDDA